MRLLAGGHEISLSKGQLVPLHASTEETPPPTPAWLLDWDNDGVPERVEISPLRVVPGQGDALPISVEGEIASLTVAEMDADGDLDLVVVGRPTRLVVNNRDGTFTPQESPLAPDATLALAFDVDGDVDTDLLLLGAATTLLRNDRLGRLAPVAAPDLPAGVRDAAPADFDGDGDLDFAVSSADGIHLAVNEGALRFSKRRISPEPAFGLQVSDWNLDGNPDLAVGTANAVSIWGGDGDGGFRQMATTEVGGPLLALLPLDLDGDGAPDLVGAAESSVHAFGVASKEERRGIALSLAGPDRAGEARANRAGVGTRVEVKSGGSVQIRERTAGTGLSQNLGPIWFGLGRAAKADYLRLVWPDGVIQAELEVAAGAALVDEVQRKAGSCPTLFAWDGSRFAFVADFLGGGGVGFYIGPDSYGPPDPTEMVAIPQLAPRDGSLEIRILEPLEELTYLDHVELLAIEHPQEVAVHPDERFAVAEPLPSGEILGVSEPIFPARATDEQNRDVTAALEAVDRDYVGPAARDPHFLGLASDSALTLEFADPIPDAAILFLHGWVEYGYSGTVFAAAQAGRAGRAPTLDVRDPTTGEWREAAVLGYPAGTPRMMTHPLASLVPPGTRSLRIRTNMTIFWDQAFVARNAAPSEGFRVTRLRPRTADLRFYGYPREYSPDGRLPLLYDYENMDPTRGFKRPIGAYTRFGDVLPLLERVDDQYVIMGPGEEVALQFDAAQVPTPAPGNRVSYVLSSDGFCKDMDLYTALPETVHPLPFHAMTSYPYPPERALSRRSGASDLRADLQHPHRPSGDTSMNLMLTLGFTGQALFSSRFLVQWIASERKGESVVPVAFWYLSILGSIMLLAYAIGRADPVFILGQSAGLVVYTRNLMLLAQKKKAEEREASDPVNG